jgi:predicted acylesterase/phospholipase RssA
MRFTWLALAGLLGGCTAFSHFNSELTRRPEGGDVGFKAEGLRASLSVDGARGNGRTLFFLALSGGGSRAAYFSAATMLKLQTVFDDVDLLEEVDVVSSVSGGSLPAAYYALSRDETLRLQGALAPLRAAGAAPSVSAKLQVLDGKRLRCDGSLAAEERQRLEQLVGAAARRVELLCELPRVGGVRRWNDATVRDLMARNYIRRWIGSWFLPENMFKYWFTAYDRADIMAQTLEDNLYDSPVLGLEFTLGELNPDRPFLVLNSTNATAQEEGEAYSFGSVFTFTDEDFRDRLRSDVSRYSIARAVMASSAFPLVFANVTLRDFRSSSDYYVHVFDGGNSDNLGLKSIKRMLLQLELEGRLAQYERIVVLQVDAFTKPAGVSREKADPRSLLSLFLDTNFVDAVDSLLQANRVNLVREFQSRTLSWKGDCAGDFQGLPPALCARLDRELQGGALTLERMVFYHFGFDDVTQPGLKARLDRIPTSFSLSDEHASALQEAVDSVLTRDNACLRLIRAAVLDEPVNLARARAQCEGVDRLPATAR